ncbi:MAG: hypothetical protein BAJALOKI3v1_700005 [Promethearchaeota archaeon]|jgi:hypothetical protein|nr:MAG: hypothetical protein BAJALOKI3v1_700005 [Candidatus Lokiarchaeota archaeon]
MDHETLKLLLDISHRQELFNQILSNLKEFAEWDFIEYDQCKTSEGIVPSLKVSYNGNVNDVKYLKVFIAAQHNEYNGLFGILEYLDQITKDGTNSKGIMKLDQEIIFFPLMNPYGFIHPKKENKSGYYLKNGTNLNRYWRRTFAPESPFSKGDANGNPLPDHAKYVKEVLQPYWDNPDISIYLLDFHETSLLERFPRDLVKNFKKKSITYKFDHWLKEGIILNIMKLYDIPYYRRPLFTKCNPSADHDHINMTIRQVDLIYEKLEQYLNENQDRLPFYFCYSTKSKEFCENLAQKVYENLSDTVWETYFPSFDHSFVQHGCFVIMSDATSRKRVYSMELESKKQFFNIFKEIRKSQSQPDYFKTKLDDMNKNITLAKESIKEMLTMI